MTVTEGVRESADLDYVAARALEVARPTALGVLGDREAAADVAQEVAITAVKKATRLRDPAALDAWLHRVAVRAALREAKRGRARRAGEQAGHDPSRESSHEPPPEPLDGGAATRPTTSRTTRRAVAAMALSGVITTTVSPAPD